MDFGSEVSDSRSGALFYFEYDNKNSNFSEGLTVCSVFYEGLFLLTHSASSIYFRAEKGLHQSRKSHVPMLPHLVSEVRKVPRHSGSGPRLCDSELMRNPVSSMP